MADRKHGLLETIGSVFVPIHRDGHKFVAIGVVATLILFLIWEPLGWLGAFTTAFVAYFFRDPDRVTPLREGLIISPADGRVSAIEEVRTPEEMGLGDEPRKRVSIFLSVLDVHINRAPIAGRIVSISYTPGLFLNAEVDKASEDNERCSIVIQPSSGEKIGVVQIAGLIARRIVTFVAEETSVGVGERFGLIRFGSRVDVYLPAEAGVLVAVGQTSIGGETVIADMISDEKEREARAG